MRTRAKFYVTGLELLPGQDAGVILKMSAVCRGDRNAEWATATPMGTLSMTINNKVAAQHWIDFMASARATGKSPEFFLDLEPSTDGWPGDGHLFRAADVAEGYYGFGTCGECGLALDAVQWDADARKPDPSRPVHPNG